MFRVAAVAAAVPLLVVLTVGPALFGQDTGPYQAVVATDDIEGDDADPAVTEGWAAVTGLLDTAAPGWEKPDEVTLAADWCPSGRHVIRSTTTVTLPDGGEQALQQAIHDASDDHDAYAEVVGVQRDGNARLVVWSNCLAVEDTDWVLSVQR